MLLDLITKLATAINAQDAQVGQRLHHQLAALVGREATDRVPLRLEYGAMVA